MTDRRGESDFQRLLDWTMREERAVAGAYPESGRQAFLDYYVHLPGAGDEAAIARFRRGTWRSETGWTARWIAARRRSGRPARVLDAGSGFGTHAMLFAAAGAEVTGVDLRPDRLEVADARAAAAAARLGLPLAVRNVRIDLTKTWDADYDLVWVYNALSHIDPPERFLALARRHLAADGVLVIGDINGEHPGHTRRLSSVRHEVHQQYLAPDGQRADYAVERQFGPGELRRLVRDAGYRVVRHELLWGGLGVAPEALYRGLLRPLQASRWLGRRIARRQWLAAAPSGG